MSSELGGGHEKQPYSILTVGSTDSPNLSQQFSRLVPLNWERHIEHKVMTLWG